MATFYDDFERANGTLGSNWTDVFSSSSIVSGSAVGSGGTFVVCNAISDGGRNEAEIRFVWITGQTYTACVGVKMSNAARAGYWAGVYNNAGTWTFAIWRRDASANTVVASTALGSYPVYSGLIHIEYNTDTVSATLDGANAISYLDTTYVLNAYMGMWLNNSSSVATSFRAVGGAAVQLDVAPDVVGNYGSAVTLTATGTGTTWTSGTPGSPAFTCNHGTITAQVVNSTTEATLTFDPGDYLGAVTFTDPDNGTTDTIVVTSDVGVIPPGGTFLSQEAIDYIERSAIAETNPTIANREMDVHQAGAEVDFATALGELHLAAWKNDASIQSEPVTAQLLWLLYRNLSGYVPIEEPVFDLPTTNTPVKFDTEFLVNRFSTTAEPWTIDQLANMLAGDPFASHQDILTAIDGLPAGDNTEVLEAIAGVKGDPLATIKAVLDYLFAMRTVSEWTLGNVKDWIEAVRGTDQPTIANVLAKLALIQAGNLPSLNDIDEHLSTFGAVITAIDLVLGAQNKVPGTVAYIVDDIWDAVQGLQNQTGAVIGPLWPGEANVDMGTPVALTDGLVVTGPLDGLLIDITGVPTGRGGYPFGEITSYTHVGAVVFATDNGYYERSQSLGLEVMIITPRTMLHAANATFRLNSGFTGTVTPWTVSA